MALTLLLGACAPAASSQGQGEILPDLDLSAFDRTIQQSGRPTVVNLWASWCLPCRSETPLLVEAHRIYGADIDFVGIDVQDDQVSAQAFVAEFGVLYPNYFDPAAAYRVANGGTGVPITYFFARNGTLFDTHVGVLTEQQLALALDELLAN